MAGEVAAGETMTTPPGMAALLAAAMVSPEQSGPTRAVTFSEFTPGEKQVEIAGTVLDRRDKAALAAQAASSGSAAARAAAEKKAAAAAAALPPKAVTLKFEALDKSGAVLGSQSVTTEPLQPGKSAQFRVKIDAANAVAYRYTIAD